MVASDTELIAEFIAYNASGLQIPSEIQFMWHSVTRYDILLAELQIHPESPRVSRILPLIVAKLHRARSASINPSPETETHR
jgi:hypothetical protein